MNIAKIERQNRALIDSRPAMRANHGLGSSPQRRIKPPVADTQISITSALTKRDIAQFYAIGVALNAGDPNYVQPLKMDIMEMFDPAKNPFYGHADVQPMLAWRGGKCVGRISAHIDKLALEQPPEKGMGPGTGNWGFLDAADAAVAAALICAAEDWLKGQGMSRALGPLSLSVWDQPGVLTFGHDHPPTVLMGHDHAAKQGWIEAAGYHPVKTLQTSDLDITVDFPPLIQKIVAAGERSSKIHLRRVDKNNFAAEVAIIVDILNDAWSENWGFVPFTPEEIAYTAKKMKPIVHEELIMIAEVEGAPKAFMITLPDMNEVLLPMRGKLLPFGWLKLVNWIRKPKARTMRVPLMGVKKELQNSRVASQLAFMMIEYIRREAIVKFGSTRGEIGWVLDDNQGMNAISEAINSKVNRVYTLYAREF